MRGPLERAAALLGRAWRMLDRPILPRRGRGAGGAAPRGRSRSGERGVALILVVTVVTILTAVVSDFSYNSNVQLKMALNARDDLKAYYLARSGMNLSRLIIAFVPQLNAGMSMLGPSAPQIPLTLFASYVLEPFNTGNAAGLLGGNAEAVSASEGLGDLGGEFTVDIREENCRANVNPSSTAKGKIAWMLLHFLRPARFNPIFENRDPDGQFTKREDFVEAIVDYADRDFNALECDYSSSGEGSCTESTGAEADPYQLLSPPYVKKDFPYCSIDELHMVRGMSDDLFYALSDSVTIYPIGGGDKINPNCATTELLSAFLCSGNLANEADAMTLCDPNNPLPLAERLLTLEALRLVQRFNTADDFIAAARSVELEIKPAAAAMIETSPYVFTAMAEARAGGAVRRLTAVYDARRAEASRRTGANAIYWREE